MADSIRQKPVRGVFLRRTGWIFLGVAAAFVIGLGLALVAGPIVKANLRTKYPPPGTLVDVGGYLLHLWCEGSGSPTVIMEAALGDPAVMWELVRPETARSTRTCVYDRAGLGWSDASPNPRTAENMVAELDTLLSLAQVDGPYVLVGHSYGGALVRLYAHNYPGNVAGMVLVDASHEKQFARFPEAFTRLAAQQEQQIELDAGRERPLVELGLVALWNEVNPPDAQLPHTAGEALQAFYARDTVMRESTVAEVQAFRANLEQLGAAQITTFGDIPLIVLSRGQPTPIFDTAISAEIEHMDRAWQQLQVELAQLSPQGKQVVATESGHYIPLDQPHLVIDAIEQVVAEARQ
jgi:pimeloyl-ACP methyl ester carboxylesterase